MSLPPSSLPTSTSSLLFPSQSQNFSRTLSSLKRSTLSISNRLHSIRTDSLFVTNVASTYQLPLIANERCGSWYIPPDQKGGSAYFKSTDGHQGQWSLSTRRLNLQILEMAEEYGGCIIVDSTRRGKSMPDALVKTVPIWCAVINRLLFPEALDCHLLHTPQDVVGPSEYAQISAQIPGFLEDIKALQLDTSSLRASLNKPLHPVFITPTSPTPFPPRDANSHPLILLTASRHIRDPSEATAGGYIQGAGDDSEGWAHGLTPTLFWTHAEKLLSTPEEELPSVIAGLITADQDHLSDQAFVRIKPTTGVFIGTLESLETMEIQNFDAIISCGGPPVPVPSSFSSNQSYNLSPMSLSSSLLGQSPSPPSPQVPTPAIKPLTSSFLHLQCGTGKLGSRALRAQLPLLQVFLLDLFTRLADPSLLVVCPTGKDLSVGLTLVILCLFVREDGTLAKGLKHEIDKIFIRRRLAWITSSKPDASPSRATLQAVNAYLMQRPD